MPLFDYQQIRTEADDEDGVPTKAEPRTLAHTFLIVVASAILGALSLALVQSIFYQPLDLDLRCSRHVSAYESPLLTDVGIKFDRKTFFPGFFKQNVFQHDGGRESEVDNAWESLGCNSPGIVVPPDVGEAAGLTGRARMPGSEDYFGFVEVLHQLHCLNLVRKALYYNFEHYSAEGKHPFGAPPDILKLHVAHCLETVRQQLVCAADFNLLGYVHVQDAHPMPDFATQHVCRNFEDIRQWAVDHEDVRLADMPASLLQARPGDIVLAESP